MKPVSTKKAKMQKEAKQKATQKYIKIRLRLHCKKYIHPPLYKAGPALKTFSPETLSHKNVF